jgi:Uma2 family endonuclease
MTVAARIAAPMTVEEFLAFLDARPLERWQLIDGQPLMMAGGTLRHNEIALNLVGSLRPAARKKGCRTYASDVLVRSSGDDDFAAIPDVFVRCGPSFGTDRLVDDPSIIIEVLSPSTMRLDRGSKFERYRSMASVEQIVLVYQDQIRVEVWSRVPADNDEAADGWTLTTLTRLSDQAVFPGIEASVSLADIYDDALPETGT